jgi:subfamily B ATP-binding cassette protein MsbA
MIGDHFMRRFRPYLKYLRSVRGELIAAVFYAILFALTNGVSLPTLIKYVFPVIFDRAGPELPLATVILIAASIPVAFLLRAISGYLNSFYVQLAGVRILEALRTDYFRKLQLLPLSFVQGKAAGDLISRGMSDTGQLQSTLTTLASDGIKQPVQLLATIGTLIFFAFSDRGVWLVLASLVLVPLAVLPVRYVGKKVIKRAYQLQASLGAVTTRFSENLSAAREVRAFSLEERETRRFAEASRDLITSQIKIAKYVQALTPAIEVIAALAISVTLVFAYGAGISESTFVAIITALYFSYEPIKKIGAMNNEYKRGLAALDRLEFVLHAPVSITDPAQPVEIGRPRGDLAFQDVSFAYQPNEPVLRDVSIRIPAGTVCALVGPSGAGKSTFANLVPRFYEAGAGRVTIDGHDVRALRLADLRRNIAVVSQEPVLFNDTIFNNLQLGRPDATRAEVEQAARDAFAHDFIQGLPQGYETMVGERGALLSGGQKQRVALARAFLRNAPLLILDEATSALDSDSEAAIQAALKKLVVGKTVLIIAHRFSTIRDASLILVFDQGRIVASGTHAQLYAGNPLYRSLYDRQQGGESRVTTPGSQI